MYLAYYNCAFSPPYQTRAEVQRAAHIRVNVAYGAEIRNWRRLQVAT